mmetsp:Transcript_35852/g.83712  ORF Transcript_35852/g.83712 Transcript_35852/m.83712 type:complete len:97 (+) Transcript_35852:33-323(+)
MLEKTPSYNERLAYGTDQGRWLAEQVDMAECSAKQRPSRSSRPQRVYHELEQADEPPRPLRRPAKRDDNGAGWLFLFVALVAVLVVVVVVVLTLRM